MINRQFGIGWEYLHVNDTWRVAYPARRRGPTAKPGERLLMLGQAISAVPLAGQLKFVSGD